jgi:hypothetical protein
MKLSFMEENQQRNRSFLFKIEEPGYSLQKSIWIGRRASEWKNLLFSDKTLYRRN